MTQQIPEGFVLDQEEQKGTTEIPQGFVLDAPGEKREDTPENVQTEKGFFESFTEWFSGEDRRTANLDQLPTIVESGFLKGASPVQVAKIAAMTTLTNDPNELANIIQKTMPNVRVQYDKDAQGNIYPVLVNPDNGITAIVDRPGADIMNLGQFIGQSALFATGGGQGSIVRTALVEGGKETALQTTQAAAGGDFDAGDVVTSAAIGGGFEGLNKLAGFSYRALAGKPVDEVQGLLAASDQFNVPVLTSDIYNPKNWFERGAQITSEWLPVVGTGGVRHAQQEARQLALDDFVNMYRGGTYEEVVQEIGKKNDELRNAAGAVYNRVNPYLDQLSREGVPMDNAMREIEALSDYLTTPGLDIDDSVLAMADDLEQIMAGTPQSFQVLKDNISAWHERINSLDPNSRALPSKVKARFDRVLTAARRDRDGFAKNNLSEADYAELKKADQAWGEVVTDMSTTKLKAILDKGEATPEVVRNMMFSRNQSDIQRLYKSLTPQGQSAARSAFITQIADDLAKQQRGLSPTSFATQMNKYQDGIDVLFEGKRKDEVNGFINLLQNTARAQEVERGAGSQTFERLAGMGAVGAAGGAFTGMVPPEAIATYASIGGLSRLFESPRVRSILTKANGLEAGSTQLQQLGTQFNRFLAASMQANPLKGTTEFERELSEELRAQTRQPEGVQ